jgi:hypothetical protein
MLAPGSGTQYAHPNLLTRTADQEFSSGPTRLDQDVNLRISRDTNLAVVASPLYTHQVEHRLYSTGETLHHINNPPKLPNNQATQKRHHFSVQQPQQPASKTNAPSIQKKRETRRRNTTTPDHTHS